MAVSSQGSTFSFNGSAFTVTNVSVKAPTPEIANVTGINDPLGKMYLVPTGDFTSPGTVDIEAFSFQDPKSLVGILGSLAFSTPAGSVTYSAICTGAEAEARVGDALRCRLSFTITDYT